MIKIIPFPITDPQVEHCFNFISTFTHFLFTSRTAVEIFFQYSAHQVIDRKVWRNITFYAIGTATAELLEKKGIIVDKIAEKATAEGVVALLSSINLKDACLCYPHSLYARPLIDTYLQTDSISFYSFPLYYPENNKPDPLPNLIEYEEIVLTSPSVVEAFFAFFPVIPDGVKLKTIGEITEKALYRFIDN